MINVSGFNVYPNEIEDVAMSHPGVLEAGAVGVPDARTGEAVKLVVVRKDPALTEADLIAYCRQHLTGYKTPRQVEFRDALPKTNIGKILRRELREASPRNRHAPGDPLVALSSGQGRLTGTDVDLLPPGDGGGQNPSDEGPSSHRRSRGAPHPNPSAAGERACPSCLLGRARRVERVHVGCPSAQARLRAQGSRSVRPRWRWRSAR